MLTTILKSNSTDYPKGVNITPIGRHYWPVKPFYYHENNLNFATKTGQNKD